MNDSQINNAIDDVIHVLDEYTRWFSGVLIAVFYPETKQEKSTRHIDAFNDWSSRQLPNHNMDVISAAEQNCIDLAQKLMKKNKQPSASEFKDFIAAYNNFVKIMRQFARNAPVSHAHLDPVTGLRVEEMAKREFKRELDRVVRDGKLFSIALLHINIQKDDETELFVKITDMIKRSIRSFDDAYILDNGNILLLLKQADSTGGIRALKRLKSMLSSNDKIPKDVKILSCVAEPGEGDSYETLLGNMRLRLDREPKDQERILEYVELSPVERFMQQNT